MLTRHETEPGREIVPAAELAHRRREGLVGERGDRADDEPCRAIGPSDNGE
jgi:hypothetical protein